MARLTVEKPRSALVTGAGSGMGRSIAIELARREYALTLVGRRAEALEETAALIHEGCTNAKIRIASFDLSASSSHEDLIAEHASAFGGLDGLVVSSGVYVSEPLLSITESDWEQVFATNFSGTRKVVVSALAEMLKHQSGRIVLIGSVVAGQSEPGSAAYSASKAAVQALVRSVAVEYASCGIAANAVAPGWVHTAMAAEDIEALGPAGMRRVNPMGRAAEPEEIASLAVYLISEAPLFLNGATIPIDGGQSIVAPAV